jgi:translation initiation factor eIF-2B subunit delta
VDARELIDTAARDRMGGAHEVALTAAEGFVALSAEIPDADELVPAFELAARVLLVNQTTMAPLWRLVNDGMHAIDAAAGPEFVADAVVEAARSFHLRVRRGVDRTVAELAPLVPHDARIVTFSASGTIERAAVALHDAGRCRMIRCCRSLPGGEGEQLALRLRHDKRPPVPAETIEDAAVTAAIAESDVVLVGADVIGPNFFVNKIGTRLVALAGQALGRKALVIADTSKLVPAAVATVIRDRMGHGPHASAFETVPWHETDGWLSESGLASAMSVEPFSHDVELHPKLRDLLDDLRIRSPGS